MDDDWIKSPAARRILVHWADPRPAWLWSQDGTSLLWRNGAARYFGAKLKKSGLRLAPPPTPIKGQVGRLIRLGSSGRSSLSRMQFLAGGRPSSATTIVTPLEDRHGRPVALIVGVDAIDPEILAQPAGEDGFAATSLFPHDAAYLVVDADGMPVEASPGARERFAALPADAAEVEVDGERRTITRYKASPSGHQLILIHDAMAAATIDAVREEEGLAVLESTAAAQTPAEPRLPGFPAESPDAAEEPAPPTSRPAEPETGGDGRLSSLFDRLADTEALYAGLPPPEASQPAPEPPVASEAVADTAEPDAGPADLPHRQQPAARPDVIAAVIEFEDDLAADRSGEQLYRVTGRGFAPLADDAEAEPAPTAEDADDEMERASRQNFSELSRILSDRVAGDLPPPEAPEEAMPAGEPAPAAEAPPARDRALINIAAETFILNRLPLGILVFRDQQVLFANRALTDLVGHGSVDSLREAGLTSVFPSDDPASAGPVTHLVRRDGAQMPVTARLQSITWQGRPALMLSAMSTEPRKSHEVAVRDFAALLADLRNEGFIALDRSGVLAAVSDRAAALLGPAATPGSSLVTLLDEDGTRRLRGFLDRAARFAETERPALDLRGPAGATITLFAEGMAGIVSGYFGLVAEGRKPQAGPDEGRSEDASMLARVSRGVRRPLNTIIGFADLIRSAAFGTIENHRYLEYARDIKTAGQEIAVLVDELDDYARLSAGTFAVRPAELDLAALLESCILRVRGQANAARVLVRSAISEDLPHIRADRASLGQAVLNLLASAIDQTPPSGSVILSAQKDDAGGIVINVRDSGEAGADPGERFVVFRDGVGKDGETLAPVRSSVGLALTRSLVAVNACTLSVTPAGAVGTIFSLGIPAELIGPAAA